MMTSTVRTFTGEYGLRRTRVRSKFLDDYCVGQLSVSRSKVSKVADLPVMADVTGLDHTYSCISRAVQPPKKRKRDAELQEDHQTLEDRYMHNTAVIPDLCPALFRPPVSAPSVDLAPEEPLYINGRTVEDFQEIYHSMVDPLLRLPSGRLRPYSLDLGLRIKQRLWEALNRPSFCEEEQADGSIRIREIFSTPGAAPPRIEVDISGEPSPKRY
ncbi:uncharacterized protein [Misgurnus anguillicaudatus]|uniref:uncharacterized protein isoform X1 n=1 Tax=Misgurnus anguillicaudatus TaxID=75329 RepID=UPI003CCFC399